MDSCPSCGKDSPANSLHCVHCGAKFSGAPQRTQFGMPALRPMARPSAPPQAAAPAVVDAPALDNAAADDAEKAPSSPLAGLAGLQQGARRPGSLLQGLPKFRGAGNSPLTSGEFNLGGLGGLGGLSKGTGLGASSLGKGPLGSPLSGALGGDSDTALGIYSAAKRSSLAPEASLPPTQANSTVSIDDGADTDTDSVITSAVDTGAAEDRAAEDRAAEDRAADAADAATMAMQSVRNLDLARDIDAVQAVDKTGEVGPTMVLQGVVEADLSGTSDAMTAEERLVAQVPHVSDAAAVAAAVPLASAAAASAPVVAATAAGVIASATEPPLPTAMRGSERAHHPGGRGLTQARVDETSGSNGKWIVIGVLVLAAVGAAIWFATR